MRSTTQTSDPQTAPPQLLFLMSSQQEHLRQRPKKEDEAQPDGVNDVISAPADTTTIVSPKQHRDRGAMAKGGIRSLLVALSLPLSSTLSAIYLFGHRQVAPDRPPRLSPPWYLPLWMLHGMTIASSILMGLSAWLVWAAGGFHRNPQAFPLYLAQFGLSLVWDPIMFTVGANWLGLAVVVGLLGTLVGCYRSSRNVNPIAGDLVMLCLAWTALLSIVNLRVLTV